MSAYVGIDLGTSGVKILAVDGGGKILAEVGESYPVYTPREGWSEQNPEDWFAAVMRGLARLPVRDVEGISFGGQMHGLVVLDDADNVIRPCILWNDGRSAREAAELNALGTEAFAGNMAFPGFTAPKLLWLRRNERHNFARIAKIMLPKDYIAYRLCGEFVTDYSDASGTLLLDVANREWSDKMLDICGISRGQMPVLCESFAPVGHLRADIAESLGWGRVTVAAGAGDNAAAAVGTGAVHAGRCNISLGTSGTIFISTDKFLRPQNGAIHSFAHANGAWHLMGCILSAAGARMWWNEKICRSGYDSDGNMRGLMGKNSVYFMPYLSGERCPHNDASVRGAFLGLSHGTEREHMELAVMEGVAFALRDCISLVRSSGIEVTSSTICGGGARSALWREVVANVLGVGLSTVETEQGPAYGAAMLAMVACGAYGSVQAAADGIVRLRPDVQPSSELSAAYDERYARYKELYPLLKDWYLK